MILWQLEGGIHTAHHTPLPSKAIWKPTLEIERWKDCIPSSTDPPDGLPKWEGAAENGMWRKIRQRHCKNEAEGSLRWTEIHNWNCCVACLWQLFLISLPPLSPERPQGLLRWKGEKPSAEVLVVLPCPLYLSSVSQTGERGVGHPPYSTVRIGLTPGQALIPVKSMRALSQVSMGRGLQESCPVLRDWGACCCLHRSTNEMRGVIGQISWEKISYFTREEMFFKHLSGSVLDHIERKCSMMQLFRVVMRSKQGQRCLVLIHGCTEITGCSWRVYIDPSETRRIRIILILQGANLIGRQTKVFFV